MADTLSAIKKAIKKGDLSYKAVCALLIGAGYSNIKLQTLEVRNKVYRYLHKNYNQYLQEISYPEPENKLEGMENLWICWFQGMDKAPELVKKCYASVCRHMPDKKLHVITFDNMADYVQFPDYIMEKWEKGIISNTHLSDLLRMELLIRYGGTWMDATVYLTGPVPEYMYGRDLFLYSHSNPNDITELYNNWFIVAGKDNVFLKTVRDLLYEFWRRENKVREYFVWHLFVTMALKKYPQVQRDMFYMLDYIPEMVADIIFQPYQEAWWSEVVRLTPIHKLSNRFQPAEDVSGTYYDFIMNREP